MIKKPTLVLLVFAIALGLAVYYFDWKRGQTEKPPVDTSKSAFSVDASNITAFTISHPAQSGDVPIQFEKRNGAWWITQPIDAEADQSTADGIVDQLAEDRFTQTEPGTEDRRKAYGLDPAQASVEFQLRNGSKHLLSIGNKDFSSDSVYTIIDGGQSVALLPEVLGESTGKSVQQLRDRSVLHLVAADLERVEIHDANGDIALTAAKGKPDQWTIEAPATQKGKLAPSWKVIDPFTNLQADNIIDHPTAKQIASLANPAIRAVFTSADGKQVTLRVSKPSEDILYAQSSDDPALYTLKKQALDSLNLRPADLVLSNAGVNP
ncbi:MAG TPA: DUF4340 domain-containing protein [Candidatus Acidoferrales bacterium]|jgi:hypothetical protein|nr:DUF4340 domain-containing protein [Candidatus Acidoferrales bacterium]